MLKVITGIMEPTRGSVVRRGNVAALLELASGFDGDLTVRENAYLRGAMLGYTRDFMDKTYKQIIEFAELENFEDRQFKQLSSGMKSRLAFSIASLVNPDILILDEVLSVGDGAFRRKSEAKMREIISSGATTILVSHSVAQIRELCNKVLWLDHGKQIAFGPTQEICDAYEHFLATPPKMQKIPENIDEISETSLNYRLYLRLAEKERRETKDNTFLKQEPTNTKENRWMNYIDSLTKVERGFLLCAFNILPVNTLPDLEEKKDCSLWIDSKKVNVTDDSIEIDLIGWAIDQNNNCPFKQIYLLYGEKVYFVQKQDRPDVATHFGLTHAEKSYGFCCSIKTEKKEIFKRDEIELAFLSFYESSYSKKTIQLSTD